MRYIGLDLGTKSLGISVSDITNTIASSYKTINFDEDDYGRAIKELESIVQEINPKAFVLGLPKNMNNSLGPRALVTLDFQKKLEDEFKVKVYLQDERLTSKEADFYMIEGNLSRKKRKKKIDSLAATIILQSFLDKERNEKNGK